MCHFPNGKSTRLIDLVTLRITAGANAWRNVDGLTRDRRKSSKGKGNVLTSCVMHQCTRDDGTSRETTGEGPGLRKQPGKNNHGS